MAVFNEKYYTGVDHYSDGDIEDTILDIVKMGKTLDDLSVEEASFPVVYHLSDVRKNIFVWYPFKKDARVLEIGAGCGAVTGILCEKCASVTSVDLSKRRATINYERNKKYDNLEIIVGNQNDIPFDEAFDYVILNGVFEYAGSFTEGEKPYETFLASFKDMLKPDGRILIAIENRLGAKYFAGAPEDHVDLYFKGINEYEGITSVKTFSKAEMAELCNSVGLMCNKFYYPYPDYKFPYEIFTDESINSSLYGRPMFQFNDKRLEIIKEDKLNAAFAREHVADKFANSFLVEITKSPQYDDKNISYVKLNMDRNEDFRIYTQIWSEDENGQSVKHVAKYPIGQKASAHIARMEGNITESHNWEIIPGKIAADGGLVYPFLNNRNLDDILADAIEEKDRDKCLAIFNIVWDVFLQDAEAGCEYQTPEFTKVFGRSKVNSPMRCKQNMNIDLILDNIFVQDNKYVLIDAEWIFPFLIPVEYVMWRMLNEAFYKRPKLHDMFDRNAILASYGINAEAEEVFREWEHNFAFEYVGGYKLQKYSCDKKAVDVNTLLNQSNRYLQAVEWANRISGKVYFDFGGGFSEAYTATANASMENGYFRLEYDIPQESELLKLRFDPVEEPCVCHINGAYIDGKNLNVAAVNAIVSDSEDYFITGDPVYEITGDMAGTKLVIEGSLRKPIIDYAYTKAVSEKIDELNQKLPTWPNFKRTVKGGLRRIKRWAINVLKWCKRKAKGALRRVKRIFIKIQENKKENLFVVLGKVLTDEAWDDNYFVDSGEVVDVIVPIYNGYDYLVKLFPTLLRTSMKTRIILVDDKSPDERVHEIEKVFAAEHDNVILLENPENYGFVKTVNNALAQSTNHVALVNTDTELPEGWLERLMKPIFTEEKIGSTTPYTNSGTIFSFPNFCYNNEIYRGMSVDEIDEVFGRVKPRYVQAPTGVGFCMGMNKHAIAEIGTLDYETFSKGFGEENDWCQRAEKAGYKNVQVENLFVYHKHGGSFSSAEKAALLEHNVAIVNKRYPNYSFDVSRFISRDANKDVREIVQILLDMKKSGQKSILAFDHNLGGGATEYLNGKVKKHVESGDAFTVIRYDLTSNTYMFIFESHGFKKQYVFNSITELEKIGKYFHFDEIYINELVTYPVLTQVFEEIVKFSKKQGAKLVMLMHDYFPICPSINLLNEDGKYCGFPAKKECDSCFRMKNLDTTFQCADVKEWQNRWKAFFDECDEIRCFSEDTRNRMIVAYGNYSTYTLVPHSVDYLFPINKEYKRTKTVNIGLIGTMTLHKGREAVKEMLKEIEERKLDVNIVLIGAEQENVLGNMKHFRQTGRYQAEELPQLIYENDIDMFLIPSVWPETFSYTSEELMQMGLPVACFDIGAPAERICKYEKGLVIPEINGRLALDMMLDYMDKNPLKTPECKGKIVCLVEYVSFSSRYRIEHLVEELMRFGVTCEIWTTDNIPKNIDWDSISKFVVYRCRNIQPFAELFKEIKAHGKEMIYDIDDYIFNYSEIKNFAFMQGDDYKDFDVYSAKIRECMDLSDRFITSTDTLAKEIEKAYPTKKVFVNRNMSSSKMMILSAKALIEKSVIRDGVTMGYFSGSNTHNGDFELISDVVFDVMKNYPQVKLMIVGCLELPEKFDGFDQRIKRVEFVDWRRLPELIASIDINLMPLERTLFHECKSENKWMEAAFVKVPTIASSNREMVANTSDKKDIVLCTDRSEWRENLTRLVEDEELRNTIAENAYNRVLKEKSTLSEKEALYDFVVKNK